jgi:hypothetical protein
VDDLAARIDWKTGDFAWLGVRDDFRNWFVEHAA